MKACLVLPLLLLSFICHTGFAQEQTSQYLFVDSLAKTVKYRGDLTTLTKALTDHWSSPRLKARAIFIWITENIRYDMKDYNRHEYRGKSHKEIKCRDDEDCAAKKESWETQYIDRVVKRKKAVCQGYALLFQRMCTIAGIRAEYLTGYTKQEYYQVGMTGQLNHAWNSVLIDSTYYLLDLTWAAGGVITNNKGKLIRFSKLRDEYYWMTPARDFVRNHFPQNAQWTLIPNYTLDKFAENPYYQPDELPRLHLLEPASGVLHAKKGDTIRFKIDYPIYFQYVQINSNLFHNPEIWITKDDRGRQIKPRLDTLAVKLQQYIPYKLVRNLLEFNYVVTDSSLYYLDILFDRHRILRFNVQVTE